MIATARESLVTLISPAAEGAPIWWTALPQDCPTPAVRLTLVSDLRGASHAGSDGLAEAVVQVDVFGDDAGQCQAIRDAILTAAHGVRSAPFDAILHDSSREDVDEDGTYSAACDLRVIYRLS